MSKRIIIILITLIYQINSLQFKVSGEKKQYCFTKTLLEDDIITLNFVVSSESPENIRTTLINIDKNTIIFEEKETDYGSYKSEEGEDSGKYELCFYPLNDHKYYISFDFYISSEEGIINELAQDKDIQEMGEELKAVTSAFIEIESNSRHINDRRYRHNKILRKIIHSVDNLTLIKITVVTLLSLLQICIIRRFFGPDKRVSKVKGAYSTEL